MIAKISKGGSFRGALNYVLGKEKAELIGGNMIGETARELSSEYGRIRQIKKDIEKPVYHVSLALPEGESFTPEQWQTVAADYLSQMGLDPSTHQYIVAQHQDTKHQHVHIIANRIALDGELFNVFRDQIKSKDVCRRLEAKYGLTEVSNEKKTYRAKTTQKERQMNKRTGRSSEKTYVQEKLNLLLQDKVAFTPQELSRALEDNGIILIPNVASTGKINGFSFQYAGRNYTGGQVGYAWKYLEPHLTMDSESVSWMQEQRQRLQEGTPADVVRSIRNAVWEVGIQGLSFDTALEKQGWTLEGDRMKKGAVEYSLSSIVDTNTLRENLKTLEGFSKETKQRVQAKSRELAKHYHAPRRKSFMAEMRTEDIICGLMMFPEVMVFLVVLSVLTETIRRMEKPRNEAEFKAQMKAIWEQSNTAVLEEVKRTQEAIKNAGIARRNKANQSVIKDAGRESGKESGDRKPSVREVGAVFDRVTGRVEGSGPRDEGGRETPPVETKNTHSNDGDRLSGGSSPVVAGLEPAGGESRDDETASASWGAVAVEEWASLARDLAILSGGEEMKTKEKSKSVLYKEQVWDRQHSALQAPLYRVTVRGRGDQDGKTINLCKDKSGVEHLWTADEVRKQIPSLEYWNARNYDIYITPMDDKFHHLLLDDLTQKGVEYIKERYNVSLIQTSSKDNFQAIIRVPKKEVSTEEQTAGNLMLRELNHLPDGCGGDKSISAPRHPFRMVGFNNKKPNKNNVQTKIEYLKPDTTCERATKELERIRTVRLEEIQKIKELRIKNDMTVRLNSIETVGDISVQRPEGETAADKDFRFRWNRILGLAKRKVKEGLWADVDRSAIDYRVCKELLENGYSEQATASAMQRCSPSIYDRHDDPDDYIRRTVSRAVQDIEKTNERGDIPFFNDGR